MPLIAALLAVAVPAQSGWITLFDEPGESTSFRIVDRRPGAAEAFVWVRHVYPRPRAGGVKGDERPVAGELPAAELHHLCAGELRQRRPHCLRPARCRPPSVAQHR
jgi:hypothetical protein